MSIRTKIILLVLGSVFVCIFFTSLLFIMFQYRELKAQQIGEAKKVFVQAKNAIEGYLQVNDIIAVINYVWNMKNTVDTLSFIEVKNVDEEEIANIGSKSVFDTDICMTSELFGLKGEKIGEVKAVFSYEIIKNKILSSLRPVVKNLFYVSVIILLLTMAGALYLALVLIRPIMFLVSAAKEVAEGNFSVCVVSRGKDEISLLAKEFNFMVERVGELDKLKDEFVSMVSHELRSPINSILGYAEQILKLSVTSEQKEYIDVIKRSSNRLLTFINNILDIAKIKAGRFELECRLANISDIVNTAISMMKPQFDVKNIKLDVFLQDVMVNVDVDKILRVMINLLSNAQKYSLVGGKVEVVVKDLGKQVMVSVKDNGPGIPEDYIPFIFDKFIRVKETKEYAKGTGLGLHLTKQLVEMHKGKIWVESRFGEGAKFVFTLPKGGGNKDEKNINH